MSPGLSVATALLVSVQSCSCVRLFVIPWTAACQTSLSLTISQNLLKLMSIESVMSSKPSHLLSSVFPSSRVFTNESALHSRWPEYWRFSFSISSSNEYLGLTSFRIDWFDLLAVQGTLKSLLQHHSSKVSILWYLAFSVALGKSLASAAGCLAGLLSPLGPAKWSWSHQPWSQACEKEAGMLVCLAASVASGSLRHYGL